jgi:agmatinase
MPTKTKTYFNIPEEYTAAESSRCVLLPVPYDSDAESAIKKAPDAIQKASSHIELFDEELWIESYKIGVQTMPAMSVEPPAADSETPFADLAKVVSKLTTANKFALLIGGAHPITLGGVAGCLENYPDLSVLQIGSSLACKHAGEGEADGSPYSHESVIYQLYSRLPNPNITCVGTRNISAKEASWMESEQPSIDIFWARQQSHWNIAEIMSTLSNNVYLSIDLSAFDSSLMPSTRCPEPGGLTWAIVTDLIKTVCVRKNVVAADIVELSPTSGVHAPNLLAAKLIYKLIGYRFALDLGVTKKYL